MTIKIVIIIIVEKMPVLTLLKGTETVSVCFRVNSVCIYDIIVCRPNISMYL